MRRIATLFTLTALVLVLIGCSGGGSNAVTPDLSGDNLSRHESSSNTMLWGTWDVLLDPVSGTAEILPLRGLELTVNVTQFLQPPSSATHLMGIDIDDLQTDWASGFVVVDVRFTHPFMGIDQYTGFDVKGVCIGDGTIQATTDPAVVWAGPDDLTLLNADGYTRWYNPTEFTSYNSLFGFTLGKLGTPSTNFTATLNGYKYFCDYIDADTVLAEFFADPGCMNPRGFYSAGNTITRTYELQFPVAGGNPIYQFQYAVVASWDEPTVIPPTDIPDDFAISANCHEPYVLSTFDESDMFYTDPGNFGGNLRMYVRVFDHQGAANGDVASQVNAIHLETPDGLIISGSMTYTDPSAVLFSQDAISATFLLETDQVEPSGQGEFPVMVIVESADPATYDQGFTVDYPDGNLSAFLLSSVSVGAQVQSDAPVAVAEIVTSDPYCPGDPIEFDASGSYDPDGGNIVSYEWDFDGDGTYGDPYDSGTDDNPTVIFTDFGTYEIDVMVTDDEAETDTLDEPLELAVGGATWVDDDNTTGPWLGTFDNPWQTIQEGIDNATGDCGEKWVLVKDGTYVEDIVLPGSITVEGYSTPAPLIQGPDTATSNTILLSSSGSKLKHFRVQPRTVGYGCYLIGTGNSVTDIEFLDNAGGLTCGNGVVASGSGHTIDGVVVDGYHKPTAGFISTSGSGSTVTNCVVLNMTFSGACSMNVYRMYQGGSTSLFAKNVAGHITFSEAFPSTEWANIVNFEYCEGSTFRNNLVFDIDNNLGDTGWTWGVDSYRCKGATFEHNTISGISGPAWIYAFEITDYFDDPTGTTHQSHIITDLTAGTMNWRWAFLGRWGTNLPVDYSCTFSVGNSFRDQLVQGTGCLINTNPVFMNVSNDDYRVSGSSPCHNAAHDGTDMGAYGGSDPLTWLPD